MDDTIFDKPYHCEYYKLNDDIWQIDNIYKDLDQNLRDLFNNMLMQ